MSEAADKRRVTMNLTPRGAAALDEIVAATGEGITDAINDALRVYAMLLKAPPGSGLFLQQEPSGQFERVHLP